MEKFEGGAQFVPYDEQLTRLLALSAQHLTPQTRLLIWPETALEEPYWENTDRKQPQNPAHPRLAGPAPRRGAAHGHYYPWLVPKQGSSQRNGPLPRRPGLLRLLQQWGVLRQRPVPRWPSTTSRGWCRGWRRSRPRSRPLSRTLTWAVRWVAWAASPTRTVYAAPANAPALRPAPIICYESIYGDFVSEYIPNGATLLGFIH
ncbi:MAG: hypothetical protein WKG07_23500 [Hymenobacter sp.]